MTPRFLSPTYRRTLLPLAEQQRDWRRDHYPDAVKAGTMAADEAQGDYAAWCAIAIWLAGGTIHFDTGWPDMELAASKALQWGDQACQKPGLSAEALAQRERRRDGVAAILSAVSAMRAWLEDLNARARAQARQKRAA